MAFLMWASESNGRNQKKPSDYSEEKNDGEKWRDRKYKGEGFKEKIEGRDRSKGWEWERDGILMWLEYMQRTALFNTSAAFFLLFSKM